MALPTTAPHAHRWRIILFASGDFAFNLYWQSVMVFLLFYYTDAVNLPIEAAAFTYMCASIWDGIVNLLAGIMVDRKRATTGYRRYLVLGAVPLGVAFVLAYLPPPLGGAAAAVTVFVGHLLFRTAYAMVNVPYLALSARISLDSNDRRLMAGLRMLFGTAALVTVTLGTSRLGGWITGGGGAPAYFAAAAVFAAIGTIILIVIGIGVREVEVEVPPNRPTLIACLSSLARNRAFVTLNAATMAMIVAATVFGKSVLYYYKYQIGDIAAGQVALAAMGVAGAIAVPLWVLLCRQIGNRATWLVAIALAVPLLGWFGGAEVASARRMAVFLMAMQVMLTGLNIVFWSMLPNTIEYGERSTGLRVEGIVFGLAALLQRIALGLATATLGWSYRAIGYVANAPQPAETLEGMRWTMALIPLVFLALSGAIMVFNPLTRNAHAAILAELERRKRAGAGQG